MTSSLNFLLYLVLLNLSSGLKTQQLLVCACNENSGCFYDDNIRRKHKLPRNIRMCFSTEQSYCYVTKEVSFEVFGDRKKNLMKKAKFAPVIEPFTIFRYGCLTSARVARFACANNLFQSKALRVSSCCNDSSFCNLKLASSFTDYASNTHSPTSLLLNPNNERSEYFPDDESGILNQVFDRGKSSSPALKHNLQESSPYLGDETISHERMPNAGTSEIWTALIPGAIIICASLFISLMIFRLVRKTLRRKRPPKIDGTTDFGFLSRFSLDSLWKLTYNTKTATATTIRPQICNNLSNYLSNFTHIKLLHQLELGELQYTHNEHLVFSGKLLEEDVSVKVFFPQKFLNIPVLWKRTVNLYNKFSIKHESIDGVKACDVCLLKDLRISTPSVFSTPSSDILCGLLVGDFHPWGNLRTIISSYSSSDFIMTRNFSRSKTVDFNAQVILLCLKLIVDTASGLNFLHFDLAGTRGRPAMAHRSLSLDCVYMKADGVCCIGDLEYAVCAPPNPLPPLDHLTAVYLEHCREYAPGEFQLRQPVQQTSTRSCELSVATNLQHHHHHQQADRPVCSLSTQSTTVAGGADRTTPKPSPSHSGGGGTGGHTDEGRSGEEVGQRVQDSCPGDSIRGEQKLHGVSEGLLRTLLATPSYPDWWPIFGVQVGNPEYMAPELLTLSMNPFDFEAHKRADVYALGKIIWEVLVWGQRSLAFRGSEDHPSAAGAKRISLNSADLSAHGNRHWAPLSQCSGCRDAEAWCRHSSVSKVIVSERLVTENSSQRASIEILEKCCSESQLPAVSLLFKGAYIQPAAGSNETEIPDLCRPFQGGPPNQWHPLPLTSCFVSTETPATYSRPLDGSSAQMVSTDQPISRLLQRLGLVIAECRQPRPELRLSALRVKKTLLRLVSEFFPKEEEDEEEEKEENEATSSGETAAKPVGEIEYSGINLF